MFVSLFILLLTLIACGSNPHTNDLWLISVDGNTLTAGEIGEEWRALDDAGRERFLSNDNPVGDYTVAISRREMIEKELDYCGNFDDERIIAFGNLWRRIEGAIACREVLSSIAVENVTDEDLDNYRMLVGTSVWYTLNPNGQIAIEEGPDHLAELPFELAFCLDSLAVGDTGETTDGITVRLDSIVVTSPALVAEAIADTISFENMAVSKISQGRVRRQYIDWQESMFADYSIVIDSVAVLTLAEYYAGNCDIDDNTVIIESDFQNWTAGNFRYEIEFAETRMPTQPSTPQWLYFLIDNMLLHQILNDVLTEEAPEIVDSLYVESESWILEMVAEELVGQILDERVEITDADIEYEYENMTAPTLIEERRIIEIALLPFEREDEYNEAVSAGDHTDIIADLPGYDYLLADESGSRITRPVGIAEVPGGYGEHVFDIDPDNTSKWIGPFPLSESQGSALFRLVEVIPERVSSFEECYPILEQNARVRLEELALMEWLQELELKYHLQINEEALTDLPGDPALW